ncbi:phage minor head protein [Nocardia carnea]|uniref:phage minor head protein n=1 Tax=Nocardia carnea TaxID=37328 RepID=UPI00245821D4|nr:phage minor head protein [Nocardia carnea]
MNHRADLVTVLALEREIEAAALETITAWLPAARAAVLPALTAAAVIPPDPDAIAIQAADEWETELDARLMPRITEIAAQLTASVADRVTGWRTGYLASVRARLTGIPANAARAARAAIERAGASVEAMRDRVAEALSPEAWGSEAARIGRTEAIGVFNGARLATAAAEEQDTGQALDKQWLSLHDGRTRASHVHADRQRVPLDAKFRVGGHYLEFPGDPNGPADEVINCRCVVVVLDGDPDQNGLAASAAGGGTSMPRTFEAMIIPTGVPGRSQGWMLASAVELVDTALPLAMKWQRTADPGHDGAYTVGVLETVELRDGAVWGRGTMLDSPEAAEAIQQIEAGVTRPSVELMARSEVLTDIAGSPITPETAEQMWIDGAAVVSRIDVAEIVAATLVSVPEFRDAHMILGEETDAPDMPLTAAATITIPTYPADAFTIPEADEPTPIYVTDDGRVQGHLATWDIAHRAHLNRERPPTPYRSRSGYAEFHQSSIRTDDGDLLRVGRLTVGGGHGPAGRGMRAAIEHYDNVSTAWAFVRAVDGELGIWVSGVVNPDADETMVRAAIGAPHSGHWERVAGVPELIAAHAVNSPGFPIFQRQQDRDGDLALVASFAPRQSRPPMPATLMEDIATRAVARYAEQQADRERAAAARQLVCAASDRRRVEARALIAGRRH